MQNLGSIVDCFLFYLHKVIDHSDGYHNRCENWSGETDDKQGAEDTQEADDPRTQRHGDHLIHSKHVLNESKYIFMHRKTETQNGI